MILIAAALAEELAVALDLCKSRKKLTPGGLRIYEGIRNGRTFSFVKTGTGPARAAVKMELALKTIKPLHVLGIGYAGALSDHLKIGDLIIIRKAFFLSQNTTDQRPLEQMEPERSWQLEGAPDLLASAEAAGVQAQIGDILTSRFIVGDPNQKRWLNSRFQIPAIDMETAAIASVCENAHVPFRCVRAVSDEAGDTFLEPFTYDPGEKLVHKAIRVAAAGNWVKRLQAWRRRSAIARDRLRLFLMSYMNQPPE